MAHLYILYSATLDKFYIGHTEQLPEERLTKHLTNHSGFTANAKDWQIVYQHAYDSKSAAYAEERRIKKSKSKTVIKKLIEKGD